MCRFLETWKQISMEGDKNIGTLMMRELSDDSTKNKGNIRGARSYCLGSYLI